MIVYKITNNVNGKLYIGQTVSKMSTRWSQHVSAAVNNRSNSVFALAIAKHGKESFTVEIIHTCVSIEEMNELEIKTIADLNTLSPKGYNLDSGGKNCRMHESTKEKLSEARKGKKRGKFTAEHRKKISDALKAAGIRPSLTPDVLAKRALSAKGDGNGMYGRKHSEESKVAMSVKKRGTKTGSSNPFFGKKHSPETIEKIKFARRNR